MIGINNQLPWHLPEDLKRFKALTISKPIIMGRKTYESLGRPLPQRPNIIISRNLNFTAENCYVVNSLNAAITKAKEFNTEEIMIIGGAEIFKQALPLATHMYLTIIAQDIAGDSYFPEFNLNEWQEIDRSAFFQHLTLQYYFINYMKNSY